MGLNPGDLIDDKYRIVRLIGEGGMGAVYEGENTRIHRRVAIKVLHANVAGMADVVARFEREAQAAGRIGSEHIVEVLDLGTLASGDRYMVMEFMDGDSLSQRIRQRGRVQPLELYPIARQLLDALAAAHGAGIVHRDLKPDNVFLLRSRRGQPDFVKLLDFGISKFAGSGSGLSMTRTGAVMGTPYYMAPEQAKGSREVDHRVDLYAVGVILYEALTGQVPFLADTFNELLFKIVLEKPRPIEELAPDLDPGFAQVVTRAMAREPGERFQTAQEMQQSLDEWAARSGYSATSTGAYPASAVAAAPTTRTPVENAPLAATPGIWSHTSAGAAPTQQKPKPSRTGLVVSLGAMVLVAGGAGVFMLISSQTPTAAPSSVASQTPPSTPVAAAPPIAPAPASAAPAPTPAPSAEASKPVEVTPAPAVPAQANVARPVRAQPAARTTPAPQKAAQAPAKTAEPASPTGRKIRQTL
jgi:serine/threonine-protein kinase